MTKQKLAETIKSYLPIIGIVLFVFLYFYACSLYPGGVSFNKNGIGFNWIQDYWCDLMVYTDNKGILNPAYFFTISANSILSLSLLIFFIQFSTLPNLSGFHRKNLQINGTLSMICCLFIFTSFHDSLIFLSCFFGFFVLLTLIHFVFTNRLQFSIYFGSLCFFFLLLTNLVYYTQYLLNYLPVLQKLSILLSLLWVSQLNVFVVQYKKKKPFSND